MASWSSIPEQVPCPACGGSGDPEAAMAAGDYSPSEDYPHGDF